MPSTPSTQNGQDQARQDARRPARAEPRRQGCCGIRTARNIENIEAANAGRNDGKSARRLSQQAHRFATSEDGLGIERVQIEADVRVRRVLNALRDKDDQLATATEE